MAKLIPQQNLKRLYEFVLDNIPIDHRTGIVEGDNNECELMGRLIIDRVAYQGRETWPHGSMPFLEAVTDAALSVLIGERTGSYQPRLRDTLRKIAHEADFQPRHEFPHHDKLKERQRDLLGCVRIIANQLSRREAVNRSISRARRAV